MFKKLRRNIETLMEWSKYNDVDLDRSSTLMDFQNKKLQQNPKKTSDKQTLISNSLWRPKKILLSMP